jgi:YidC/Oxa1 family membrane protein insertase
MGQQMYVIRNNPTPGSKAQAAYLERLHKHVTHHGGTRNRRERTIVKAIVTKGRDRNEFERKFINGLSKAGLAAQPDGTVVKSEGAVATLTAEDGTPTTAAPKRQQPKRQSKSQRQSGAGAKAAGESAGSGAAASDATGSSESGSTTSDASEATSLSKAERPQDAPQPAARKAATPKSGSGARSKAQSGQRKGGPQRPKSPSKK